MPTPTPSQASIITAGIDAGSGILNTVFGSLTNRANRKYAEKMYDRQRADALADRAFENEYNSPAEQMKRLKAAGLNPNLVYDSGGAKSVSVDTRSTQMSVPEGKAPQLNMGGFSNDIFSYFDNQYKEAQTNNVKAATDVAHQEVINKQLEAGEIAVRTAATMANTAKTNTDREAAEQAMLHAQQLFPVTLEAAKANVNKQNAEIDKIIADKKYTLDENERKAALQASTLQQSVANVLRIRAETAKTEEERKRILQEIENLKQDNRLKQFDEKLQQQGIHRNSPGYLRAVAGFLSSIDPVKQPKTYGFAQGAKESLKRMFPGF